MRESRPTRSEPYQSTYALSKTSATGLIILGVVIFVAMFYLLQNGYTGAKDGASYYLPWCLSYGIPCVLVAGVGVYWLTHEIKKPFETKVFAILCIVIGTVGMGVSIPNIAVWGNVEFFLSVLIIAACEMALGIVTLKSYLESK